MIDLNTRLGRDHAAQRGFTLLELMIVLVVITILTVLAVSAYTEQVRKSRRANAIANLGQVKTTLERWRAENPYYCHSNSTVSGYTCTTYTESGTFPYTTPGTPVSSSTDTYYTYAIVYAGSQPYYKITATPTSGTAQANDRCGTLCAYSPGAADTTSPLCSATTPKWSNSACN